MKTFFSKHYSTAPTNQEDFTLPTLQEDIEKTRIALDIAYAGFDNAVEEDMIDCYIYEINALLKRYKHLTNLAAGQEKEPAAPKKPALLWGFPKALQPVTQNPFPLR